MLQTTASCDGLDYATHRISGTFSSVRQSLHSMVNFTNTLNSLRNLRVAAQEIGHAEIAQGLLDLQGHLLGLQVQVLERQVEVRLLQTEATRLRGCLTTARQLQRVNDAYYLVKNEEPARGPYCLRCWDRREMLQGLVEVEEGVGYCPNCKVTVGTSGVAGCEPKSRTTAG